MTPKRWSFVQSLQEDLLETSRYVEFHEANRATFSVAFDKIILAAGSEINSIFEELVSSEKGNLNISKARDHILPMMPLVTSTEARLMDGKFLRLQNHPLFRMPGYAQVLNKLSFVFIHHNP